MNIRASSTFQPGSFAAFERKIVPRIMAAVKAGSDAVVEVAKTIVPVDTGALRDSIGSSVEWQGQKVTGSVAAKMPYAAYVEFGTGQRGAASAGAGPYQYSENWPGQRAQPYMRPAMDTARPAIMDAFKEQGFEV